MFLQTGLVFALFVAVEMAGAVVACRLDRENGRLLWWLFWQRFAYRQVMYAVLWKSLRSALEGLLLGWGKVERKGSVQTLEKAA
jgi:hypothetical protein